jgi:hypothetical protein
MLYSILVLGVCLASLGIFAVRAFGAPNLPRIQTGTFRVEFSDHLGRPQELPFFNIAGSYPGMPPITTSLTIHNAGSLPATYRLCVADLKTSRRSLADLLLVRVMGSSGSVLYEGGLQGMSFQGAQLRGGALATYQIEIRWPDHGGNDNRYQGQTISFGLRLGSELALDHYEVNPTERNRPLPEADVHDQPGRSDGDGAGQPAREKLTSRPQVLEPPIRREVEVDPLAE